MVATGCGVNPSWEMAAGGSARSMKLNGAMRVRHSPGLRVGTLNRGAQRTPLQSLPNH
jgi:hypothetical protein